MEKPTATLDHLTAVIRARKEAPTPDSYTSQLLEGGVERIGEKVMEEAGEVVEAAGEVGDDGRQHLIREAADLVYHLMVLLAARDARITDVKLELARRFGVSGIEEKASREE